MRRLVVMLVLLLIVGGARLAHAERLVVSLSNHRVQVTSSFTGEELVLFGLVEPDHEGEKLKRSYDLVITVTGPPDTFRTRRKRRVAGIWVNTDSREFVRVPSYLAMLSNRPLEKIADPGTRRRLQVGLADFLLPQRIGPDIADTVANDPFRVAFVELQSRRGLYRELPNAVTFLTPALFRGSIPLPADVPTGTFTVDAKLFADGAMVARTNSALEVIKVGFEQYVADAAEDYGLLYGLAAAMIALAIGWFASVVFRRD